MATKQQIFDDFTTAFKARDELRKRTLESIKSEILVFEKMKEGNEATDEKILEILKSMAKKRRESILAYEQAGRAELANKEKEELGIIESYLPEQMNEEQVKEAIEKIVVSLGFKTQDTKVDFGKAMGAVMAELKGKADGGMVGKILKELLK
ncbi:MAG: GatB/YqeY domain-containing protein [Patescibacteria group bacterium]